MLRLALSILCAVCVGAVEFRDCGSTAGSFDRVEVAKCDASSHSCVLRKGHDGSLDLHFTPSKRCEKVTAIVHGIVDELDVPFPLPNAEACQDPQSKVGCPLEPGVASNYHATLPVLHSYPTVSVKVRWELKDENNDNIVCVEFPVSIR
ncbi:protein NPC2 homolog [Trichogramma pretiosum]|uniref:protein NPC2 homolog n=1 Tax=Trichogramma pretiosum TaxID=7493 RepID=UPI0006C99ACC|nr:protein NPC2 homolog [Trichogramma pretiosum]